MSSKASPTVVMSFSSSSATSMLNVSSSAMTSSTRSRLSAPRSSAKEASGVTFEGSTASTSTALSVNLASASVRSMRCPLTFFPLHRSHTVRTGRGLEAEREAPVHREDRAGDVARVVTREKPDNSGDIARLAGAAHRDHRQHLVPRRAQVDGHVRVDESGGDHVHGHATGGHLARERAGQSHEAGLGRPVVGLTRHAHEGADRPHEDDRTRPGAHHRGEHRARRVEGAVEVGRHHLAPLFVAHAQGQAVTGDPSVYHRDLDGTELFEGDLDRLGHLGRGGHVDGQRQGAAGGGPARAREAHDGVAQVDEVLRDGGADAATRAGDDDVTTHQSTSWSCAGEDGAYWDWKVRIRRVRPVRTPPGGFSIVVVTVSGRAWVAARNSTGEVNWRESRSRHSCAEVCTAPSTLAMSVASVSPQTVVASAASNSTWAGAIRGEWKAPPTARGVARRQPSSRCRAARSSRAPRGPLTTTWPGPLMLATHTSASPSRAARASSSPPIRASIEPSTASAARAIAAPRTVINRAPSSRLSRPEATSAENSPRLWPSRQCGRRPRSSSDRHPTIERVKVASWARSVRTTSSSVASVSRCSTSTSATSLTRATRLQWGESRHARPAPPVSEPCPGKSATTSSRGAGRGHSDTPPR